MKKLSVIFAIAILGSVIGCKGADETATATPVASTAPAGGTPSKPGVKAGSEAAPVLLDAGKNAQAGSKLPGGGN